jgi:Bacterial antitoxin of type II TA system, VapB
MRTTLDIDDDLLQAAKERARREHKTAGQVVSELLRHALTSAPTAGRVSEPTPVYGFQPFAATGRLVTNEQIDALRSDDAY